MAIAKANSAPNMNTFERLCCRVISQGASSVFVNICRPGSEQLTSVFFKEFRSNLEFLSAFSLPVIITGDINIRLVRIDDSYTAKFTSVLESLSILQFVTERTHQLAGLLDVVITGPDNSPQDLSVVYFGLSDHMFVKWSAKDSDRRFQNMKQHQGGHGKKISFETFCDGLRKSAPVGSEIDNRQDNDVDKLR